MQKINILLLSSIIFLAAMSRLVDHPANFTPLVAMSIFAGAKFQGKWGWVLPLAAMLISDYFIGFYHWQVMLAVYLSLVLAYAIGSFLKIQQSFSTVFSAAIISSMMFFVITNLAVWAFFDWYSHDWAGFLKCYTLAIPFFRNSLVGDVIYTGIIFGAYEWMMYIIKSKQKVLADLA